jgi:cytochrome b6-f complex iron-sulfur subunit
MFRHAWHEDLQMNEPGLRDDSDPDRRTFVKKASSLVMVGGLAAGYGTLAVHAAKFLMPSADGEPRWQFVSDIQRFAVGDAVAFATPEGSKVLIARQGKGEDESNFIALSSVCPHLGCKVHWEALNNRFFCPCHNGAFDAQGMATAGPPAAAKQQLKRFRLKVERGLLYIDLPSDTVNVSNGEAT